MLNEKELEHRIQVIKEQRDKAFAQLHMCIGALAELQEVLKQLKEGNNAQEEPVKKLAIL